MMTKNTLAFLLGFGVAIAPAALVVAQDDAMMPEPEIVVADDIVEADDEMGQTVAELEELINLPPIAQLGREADEDPAAPRDLFGTDAQILALLGEGPRFVYIPAGSDPMIIPWIRDQIVVAERMADARRGFEQAQRTRDRQAATQALNILREVQERYPEAGRTTEVTTLRTQVEQWLAANIDQPDRRPVEPERPDVERPTLPPWIETNTRGILIDREDESESLVLVGDYILRRGDRVDRFPSVVVKSISAQQVVYEYEETEFVVDVNPY